MPSFAVGAAEVIMDLTGLVGGVEEAMARGGDLAALGQLVRTTGASAPCPPAPESRWP
jgi:hypothetical protein